MARSRPGTVERGYGRAHRALRAQMAPVVAAGLARCARCGERIAAGIAWDLDHTNDRRGYLGPSHRFAKDCKAGGNRSTCRPRVSVSSQRW
jgi:hypothetical protein